jgi:hypothetical protein
MSRSAAALPKRGQAVDPPITSLPGHRGVLLTNGWDRETRKLAA